MYRPVLVTPPALLPLTLSEVKLQLDIDYAEKDDLLNGLIAAATAYLDGWTGILGRCLITQTWRQDFDCLARTLRLPLFPVTSITSVKYDDPSNVEQTVDPTNYELLTDDLGAYVRFKFAFVLPQIESYNPPSVRVAYVTGDADASAVPQPIKQAMLLLIRHWFDNPTAVVVGERPPVEMPMAVDALLGPFRRTRF
jgi:uncharacterized phiE125 gp8 family phage protein